MRTRFLPVGVAMALGVGLLTASPAAASYAVESITFPGGNSEFYSPFSGPATVTFTFDGTENAATFELRLRTEGTVIAKKPVFIDPANPATYPSPRSVQFNWPALSVASGKMYQVAVYRNGNLQGSPASFFLWPRLVSITSVTPNPFFPWLDDLYKDETHVRFALAADAAAEARVYRPKTTGKCCGALVRNDGLGNLSAGNNSWDWDGRNNIGDNLAKGNYFVRIRADDGSVPPVLSKATKVAIARVYRATKTKSKPATAYHHVGPATPLVIGGGCIVFRTAEGVLQILCQGGRVSVYWRWGLSSSERIERASFVLDNLTGCPRSIRRTGHTKHESSFTMNEDLVNAGGNCYLVTARITYSYPKAS
jgi:FlgD Ig-like domain